MYFYFDPEELEVIRKYDLIDLSVDVLDSEFNRLKVTGTQVRSIVMNIFDIVWQDSTPYDDKFWLSQFGWRISYRCL